MSCLSNTTGNYPPSSIPMYYVCKQPACHNVKGEEADKEDQIRSAVRAKSK